MNSYFFTQPFFKKNGKAIAINAIIITGVAEVDGSSSTQIRDTVIPNSYDVTPVRNQIL